MSTYRNNNANCPAGIQFPGNNVVDALNAVDSVTMNIKEINAANAQVKMKKLSNEGIAYERLSEMAKSEVDKIWASNSMSDSEKANLSRLVVETYGENLRKKSMWEKILDFALSALCIGGTLGAGAYLGGKCIENHKRS